MLCSRHFKESRLSFHANHEAIRADPFGQQICDSNWSATDINRSEAGFYIDPIEHEPCVLLETLSLRDQPLLFRQSIAEYVWHHWRWHARSKNYYELQGLCYHRDVPASTVTGSLESLQKARLRLGFMSSPRGDPRGLDAVTCPALWTKSEMPAVQKGRCDAFTRDSPCAAITDGIRKIRDHARIAEVAFFGYADSVLFLRQTMTAYWPIRHVTTRAPHKLCHALEPGNRGRTGCLTARIMT